MTSSGSGNFVPLPFFFDEDPNKEKKKPSFPTSVDNHLGQPLFNEPIDKGVESVNHVRQSFEPQYMAGNTFPTVTESFPRRKSSFEVPSCPPSQFQPSQPTFTSSSAPWETQSPSMPASLTLESPLKSEPSTLSNSGPFYNPHFNENVKFDQISSIIEPSKEPSSDVFGKPPTSFDQIEPSQDLAFKFQFPAFNPPVEPESVARPPWMSEMDKSATSSVEVSRTPWQSLEPSASSTSSWQPPQMTPRKNSSDSQRSIHLPPTSLPTPLDGIEETLSNKSFASSFVIEGGKACFRCSKNNEVGANFCSRCGAQIGSPIESPSSSQICSSFESHTSTVVQEQFSKLSIGEHTFPTPTSTTTSFQQDFSAPVSFQHQAPTASQPASPKDSKRVYPVFNFGFGGSFVLTFPTLQTRYTPSGQPINSFRPSVMYTGDVSSLPNARYAINDTFLDIADGAPLLEMVGKPKELAQIISRLKSSSSDVAERLTLTLFELLLQHGKHTDNPKMLDEIKNILESNNMTTMQATAGNEAIIPELEARLRNGDREGAFEMAVSNEMWSHAFILGRLLSPMAFQKAVDTFTQQTYPSGHPIRLVYLMLTGQPHIIGTLMSASIFSTSS